MLIEVDLKTRDGRETWGKAHPTARFIRDDGTAFLETSVSEYYLEQQAKNTQPGMSEEESEFYY